jgi:hypothetical protein
LQCASVSMCLRKHNVNIRPTRACVFRRTPKKDGEKDVEEDDEEEESEENEENEESEESKESYSIRLT